MKTLIDWLDNLQHRLLGKWCYRPLCDWNERLITGEDADD